MMSQEPIGLLGLDDKNQATLFKMLKRGRTAQPVLVGRSHTALPVAGVSKRRSPWSGAPAVKAIDEKPVSSSS
jgi:hypothetical protein